MIAVFTIDACLLHFHFCLFPFSCSSMPALDPAHSRFLSEAAALLNSDSPSTSAHLLAVQTRVLHADSKPLNARQQRHHCAACGRIRHSQAPSITVRPSKKAVAQGLTGATVYQCDGCRRRAVLPRRNKRVTTKSARGSVPTLPASTSTPASVSTSASASPLPPADLAQDSTPAQSKSTDNASSKKRAKARKQGGLQALLASKQQAQPSLDLFDFLQ